MADVDVEITGYREFVTPRLKELKEMFERLFEVIETQQAQIDELEDEGE